MERKLQFPGLSNTWTMPVENRLDMQLTGIKTPLGLKVQGKSVEQIQAVGAQIEQLLSRLPDVRAVFAERVSQGFYVNVEPNRPEAARYGLTIEDIQTAVASAIGGQNIAENVEGRERYPINVLGADGDRNQTPDNQDINVRDQERQRHRNQSHSQQSSATVQCDNNQQRPQQVRSNLD